MRTLLVSGDVANIGVNETYGRPNAVPGVSPNLSHPTKNEWFNLAAFSTPQNSYGDVGRDSLRSSSVFNSDCSLLKNFAFVEGINLQFRAEYFNIFNYAAPNSNIDTSNAGTVTSTELPPRELQLALKLSF